MYVERLRAEAREHRIRAERADRLEAELRRLAIAQAVRGVLTDPESLEWSEDWSGDDGLPDAAKITRAAEDLARERPWLARVRGDVRQGQHGTAEQPVSLSALLRG